MEHVNYVHLVKSLINQKEHVLLKLWDQYSAMDRDKYVMMDNVMIV